MYASSYARSSTMNSLATSGIWVIVSIVLAIVGGIALYFTFLKKENEGKYTGFWGWMYDFLTFKKLTIESVLKILYLICALFVQVFLMCRTALRIKGCTFRRLSRQSLSQ